MVRPLTLERGGATDQCTGNLLPLKYTQPNLDDEDPPVNVEYPTESDRPNKRKARPEEVVAAIGDIVDSI